MIKLIWIVVLIIAFVILLILFLNFLVDIGKGNDYFIDSIYRGHNNMKTYDEVMEVYKDDSMESMPKEELEEYRRLGREYVAAYFDGSTVYSDCYRDSSGRLHISRECYIDEPEHLETTTLDSPYTTYANSAYESTDNLKDCLRDLERQKRLPLNCKNCGAPLHSHKCEYCGSEYY